MILFILLILSNFCIPIGRGGTNSEYQHLVELYCPNSPFSFDGASSGQQP